MSIENHLNLTTVSLGLWGKEYLFLIQEKLNRFAIHLTTWGHFIKCTQSKPTWFWIVFLRWAVRPAWYDSAVAEVRVLPILFRLPTPALWSSSRFVLRRVAIRSHSSRLELTGIKFDEVSWEELIWSVEPRTGHVLARTIMTWYCLGLIINPLNQTWRSSVEDRQPDWPNSQACIECWFLCCIFCCVLNTTKRGRNGPSSHSTKIDPNVKKRKYWLV